MYIYTYIYIYIYIKNTRKGLLAFLNLKKCTLALYLSLYKPLKRSVKIQQILAL